MMRRDSECAEANQRGGQKRVACSTLNVPVAMTLQTGHGASLPDCQGERSSAEVDSMKGEKADKLVFLCFRHYE